MWGQDEAYEMPPPPLTRHQRHLAKKLARIQTKMGVSPTESDMGSYGALFGIQHPLFALMHARMSKEERAKLWNERARENHMSGYGYWGVEVPPEGGYPSSSSRPPLPGGQAGTHQAVGAHPMVGHMVGRPPPGRHPPRAVGHKPPLFGLFGHKPPHRLDRGLPGRGRHPGMRRGHPGKMVGRHVAGRPSESVVKAVYQKVKRGAFGRAALAVVNAPIALAAAAHQRHKHLLTLTPHDYQVLKAYVAHQDSYSALFKLTHPVAHAIKWISLHHGQPVHGGRRLHHAPGPGGAALMAPGGASAPDGADADASAEDQTPGRMRGRRGKGGGGGDEAGAEAAADAEAEAGAEAVEEDSGGPSKLLIGGAILAALVGGYFLLKGKKGTPKSPGAPPPRQNRRRRHR